MSMRSVPLLLIVWTLWISLPGSVVGESSSQVHQQVLAARDPGMEDAVAKLFEGVRVSRNLYKLKRGKSDTFLEQTTCTAAVGARPATHNAFFALYKTSTPEIPSSELYAVASFNRPRRKTAANETRYSVAVWTGKDGQYWVGITMRLSAAWEFLDAYFTDGLYYGNDWKKGIAPECKHAH
jgi:hypothetical protein